MKLLCVVLLLILSFSSSTLAIRPVGKWTPKQGQPQPQTASTDQKLFVPNPSYDPPSTCVPQPIAGASRLSSPPSSFNSVLSIVGVGQSTLSQDEALLSFTVDSKQDKASDAQRQVGALLEPIVAALKSNDAVRQLKTESVSLWPEYRYLPESGRSVQDGFRFSTSLSFRVYDAEKNAGRLIDFLSSYESTSSAFQSAENTASPRKRNNNNQKNSNNNKRGKQEASSSSVGGGSTVTSGPEMVVENAYDGGEGISYEEMRSIYYPEYTNTNFDARLSSLNINMVPSDKELARARMDALAKASEDAVAKARAILKPLGYCVRSVMNVADQSGQWGPNYPIYAKSARYQTFEAMDASEASVPVVGGQSEISSSISYEFSYGLCCEK